MSRAKDKQKILRRRCVFQLTHYQATRVTDILVGLHNITTMVSYPLTKPTTRYNLTLYKYINTIT